MNTRRDAMKLALAGTVAAPTALRAQPQSVPGPAKSGASCDRGMPVWARGFEGQRKADLGNGNYFNPIIAGDYPDPTVLKDGDDYYMTHSSFEAAPGLLIWHSRDLVNWTPVAPALAKRLCQSKCTTH